MSQVISEFPDAVPFSPTLFISSAKTEEATELPPPHLEERQPVASPASPLERATETPSSPARGRESTVSPSLIDTDAQMLAYAGVVLFALAIAAAIGLVNRKRVLVAILALMSVLATVAFFRPRHSHPLETAPPPESLLDKHSQQT